MVGRKEMFYKISRSRDLYRDYTLPDQMDLNKQKFVPQVAHDRDTYVTSNISTKHDLKPWYNILSHFRLYKCSSMCVTVMNHLWHKWHKLRLFKYFIQVEYININ